MQQFMVYFLVVFLFFAIMVGAFNVYNNTNNRPYTMREFLHEIEQIRFDVNVIRDLIDNDDSASILVDINEWQPDDDGVFTLDDVADFFGVLLSLVVSALDLYLNIVIWVFQVVRLVFNFAVGVPT